MAATYPRSTYPRCAVYSPFQSTACGPASFSCQRGVRLFRRVLGASVPALRRLDDGVGGAGVHGNGDEVLEVAIIIAAAAGAAMIHVLALSPMQYLSCVSSIVIPLLAITIRITAPMLTTFLPTCAFLVEK